MQDFKNKLYNYEAEPPEEIWRKIDAELNSKGGKDISVTELRRRPKIFFTE